MQPVPCFRRQLIPRHTYCRHYISVNYLSLKLANHYLSNVILIYV